MVREGDSRFRDRCAFRSGPESLHGVTPYATEGLKEEVCSILLHRSVAAAMHLHSCGALATFSHPCFPMSAPAVSVTSAPRNLLRILGWSVVSGLGAASVAMLAWSRGEPVNALWM